MAIDPIFIHVPAVDDFAALGGESAGPPPFQAALAAVRASPAIDYEAVRALKGDALRAAFVRFKSEEWENDTPRASAFRGYLGDQAWWIEDYGLFRALRAAQRDEAWTAWPDGLRRRDREALRRARAELADEILYRQYLQWQADEQWRNVRAAASGVGLFGDLPFAVGSDSADVWSRQQEFRLDASVGVPPDAFSETGQDWGLPAYRWGVVARRDYRWLRDRARRSSDLYDGYRIDHLVGFYRTYVRSKDGRRQFVPATEARQLALGERLVGIFASAGPRVIAEDLGTVPDFVRASIARLNVPGYKVLRWEREWDVPDRPFRDPRMYPECSVATSGTHDTDPMAIWWETASAEERVQLARLPRLAEAGIDPADERFHPALRDALLQTLFESGSDLLILPMQDVFGWRDRINLPATVGEENWTWRMPWPSDRLRDQPEAVERAGQLKRWAQEFRRGERSTTEDSEDSDANSRLIMSNNE
jgi:4-alpha-glucanotransferase